MSQDASQATPFGFEPDVPTQTGGKRDSFPSQVKRVLTSATLLVIAFIVALLIHQYVMGLLCLAFGYDPEITYNKVKNLPLHYSQWSLRKVTIIFSSGPLICLIIGIFCLDFFNSLTGRGNLLRYFVLWFSLCTLNVFLAFLMLSPIAAENHTSNLYTGFTIVGAWWRIGKLLMIPLSFVALTGSVIIGFISGSMFIKFSFSKTRIESMAGRRKMLLQLYVMPVLLAAPFLMLLTTKESQLIHAFHLGNLLVMSIGMFMGIENLSKETRVYGKDVLNTIPVFGLAIAGGLMALVLLVIR